MNMTVYMITLVAIVMALLVVMKNYLSIKSKKSHTTKEEDAMLELSQTIQRGAKVFMKTEYKTIVPVVALIALGFSLSL